MSTTPTLQFFAHLVYLSAGTVLIAKYASRINWILVGVWVIGLGMALLSPDDVLTRFGLLDKAVDLVSLFTPARRFSAQAALPDVAALYFAIMWLATPVMMVMMLAWTRHSPRRGALQMRRSELRLRHWLAYLLYVPLLSGAFVLLWIYYGGQDTRFFDIGTSRVQLGLYGFLVPFSCTAMLMMVFLMLRQTIRGRAL
jgi:hypothetical protein